MKVVPAAFFALAFSWLISRFLRNYSDYPVRSVAPWWEESLKTGGAYFFAVHPFGVHLLFGLGEALYELRLNKCLLLFCANVLSHALFGLIAEFGLRGGWWLAWTGGLSLHLAWNTAILRILCHNKIN